MENKFSLIDIIIVNYNSTDCLLNCVESLFHSLGGMHATVYIQDNNSKDSIERVKKRFPEVILTKNVLNIGFASAVNQALKKSSAPYVVLLNPDSFVMEGFFDSVLGYFKENPEIGIVGRKILDSDRKV